MPDIPESLQPKEKPSRDQGDLIQWHTVSYRTLMIYILGVLLLAGGTLLAVFPDWREAVMAWVSSAGNGGEVAADDSANQQARFTNLDGSVRVRKADSVEWVSADLAMGLDEGDLVQTSGDGVARIAFADGTLYVVRPNTLIAIEENAIPSDKKNSQVTVQVSSGEVDLSTTRLTGQSRVRFADAEAMLRNESRAQVRNNPETNTREITVTKGGAQLLRGTEELNLGQYEQASFSGPDSPTERTQIVAPPLLLIPSDMAPVVMSSGTEAEVEFIWSAVATANSYRIHVSTSPIFGTLLHSRVVRSTSIRLPSFGEGDYYWSVSSLDRQGNESQQSDTNLFTIIHQDNAEELLLVVEKYVQHGRVIEVVGRTEPGATVLVNNEPVFSVAPNGTFKHFTTPLPNVGSNRVTVTAQNREGKVATVRRTVTLR